MQPPPQLSRRRFLELVGSSGGASAAYGVAMALGLLPDFANGASIPSALMRPRSPQRVVILGAGIAGLAAAYELGRAGYEVTVLEASARAGGRNFTVRHGTVIDEIGARQVCDFDDHPNLYFNAGPARIPGNHRRLLHYCRVLGVPLEVFVNENRSAYVQDDRMLGGRPIRNREYVTDMRGFLSELLCKAMSPQAMDGTLSADDIERVREFARAYGDLGPDHTYQGSHRAGIAGGGMIIPASERDPFELKELLKSDFWRFPMHWGELGDQATPMMQPVGGMDRIVAGFMRQVGSMVRLNCPVRGVFLRPGGVRVAYQDANGERQEIDATYCLNSIPSHLLSGIEHNFPARYARALQAPTRGKLFKIGLQARERFWEREGIYGGISWTFQDIAQIWYPSHGIHSAKGIVLGAYTFPPQVGEKFARLTPAERIAKAIREGEKVHPGYGSYMQTGISVAWHRMNHMLGCAARWDEQNRREYFPTLAAPVGNHFMIGDQVSYHAGWQEGALASALKVIEQIDERTTMAST
ncbi:MAG: FAD-dependent oxidoreductase [Pseudomonadota bacterium]